MRPTLLLTLFAVTAFSSCRFIKNESERGNGTITKQTRHVNNFDAVQVSSSIDLFIKQDSVYSVRVEVDGNLQDFIEVYTEGGTLHVEQANHTNLDPTGDIRVYVSGPQFKRIGASGACDVIGENKFSNAERIEVDLSGSCSVKLDVNAPKITVDMSGACEATLTGQTKDLEVDGSGSTDLKAFGLLAETVDVDLSGAGNAEVYASVKLQAGTSGAASIQYKGAASVNTDISGAGTVKKVE